MNNIGQSGQRDGHSAGIPQKNPHGTSKALRDIGVSFHDSVVLFHPLSDVEDLPDVIRRLDQPFVPVLDAAYQFAVSIGIYVREKNAVKGKEAA